MSTIYTVLWFHADGSRGVDEAEQHNSYRHIDDAYIKLRELVNKQWPHDRSLYGRGGYLSNRQTVEVQSARPQPSSTELADRIKQRADLERQLQQTYDERRHIMTDHNRIDQLADKRYPANTDDLDAELEILEARYESLDRKVLEIKQRLEDMQTNAEIFIDKIDGKWQIIGGYDLDFDTYSHFRHFFPEIDIEATVSLDKGDEGVRFYIIKTRLL